MLPAYAFSEEVCWSPTDERSAPNIDDVELLIALAGLVIEPPRRARSSYRPLCLYDCYLERSSPVRSGEAMYIERVESNAGIDGLGDGCEFIFASFARSFEDPPPLHPTLWMSIASADLVRRTFFDGRQRENDLGVRLVQQTGFPIYHLFVYDKGGDLSQSGPMSTTIVFRNDGEPELRNPYYGIELAQFNLPNIPGEELASLCTIRDMLDQLNEFYKWMTNNTSEI